MFDESGELLNTLVVTVHKRSAIDLSFSPHRRALMHHKNHPLFALIRTIAPSANVAANKEKM
jgi:hypothetical protein